MILIFVQFIIQYLTDLIIFLSKFEKICRSNRLRPPYKLKSIKAKLHTCGFSIGKADGSLTWIVNSCGTRSCLDYSLIGDLEEGMVIPGVKSSLVSTIFFFLFRPSSILNFSFDTFLISGSGERITIELTNGRNTFKSLFTMFIYFGRKFACLFTGGLYALCVKHGDFRICHQLDWLGHRG